MINFYDWNFQIIVAKKLQCKILYINIGATGVHVINELLKCGLFKKVTSVARREFDYQGPNKDFLVSKI